MERLRGQRARQRTVPLTLRFKTNFGKPHDCKALLNIECGARSLVSGGRIDTSYSGGAKNFIVPLVVAPVEQLFSISISEGLLAEPFDNYGPQFSGADIFRISDSTRSVLIDVEMAYEPEEMTIQRGETTETAFGAFVNAKVGVSASLEKILEIVAERTLGVDLKRTWGTTATTERKVTFRVPTTELKIKQIGP